MTNGCFSFLERCLIAFYDPFFFWKEQKVRLSEFFLDAFIIAAMVVVINGFLLRWFPFDRIVADSMVEILVILLVIALARFSTPFRGNHTS